jgi:hypothetical protein
MKSSTKINLSLRKRLKKRRSKLGKIDILEIPKGPLHSTLFRSAILKHSSAIKSP